MSLMDALLLEPPGVNLSQPRQQVWLALRTDGQAGSGTVDDPYDASFRMGPEIPLSSLTRHPNDPNIAVAVTAQPHGYHDRDAIVIAGASGPGSEYYNGTFYITTDGDYQFSYKMAGDPGGDAQGSVVARRDRFLFDELMDAMPAWTEIRLGPGVFQTKGRAEGFAGWRPKSGQKIIGSGMDVTIIRLEYASEEDRLFLVIGGDYNTYLRYFEASDFTVDCNLAGQPTNGRPFAKVATGAITAKGRHVRLRRIRAIHFGTQTPAQECFVISSGGAHPDIPETFDCLIEECVADRPGENNVRETTVLILTSGARASDMVVAYHRACAVRNCTVDCAYSTGPSQRIKISALSTVTENGGIYAVITTERPHGRTTAHNVVVQGVRVRVGDKWKTSAAFNGVFSIEAVTETTIKYLLSQPPESETTSVDSASIGVSFHAITADGGTAAIVENNRVLNATWGVYHDSYNTKDLIIRNNYFSGVDRAVYQNLGLRGAALTASSLVKGDPPNDTVATLTTEQPHSLLPEAIVNISGALVQGSSRNPFNGTFEVLTVPETPSIGGRPTSFEYQMSEAPAENPTGNPQWREIWSVRRLVIANNVIELAKTLGPYSPPSMGITCGGIIVSEDTPAVIRRVVITDNVIRGLAPPDPFAVGIFLGKCYEGVVQRNTVDLAGSNLIRQIRSGRIAYMNNRAPDGTLIRGFDATTGRPVDEVSDSIETATLAAV